MAEVNRHRKRRAVLAVISVVQGTTETVDEEGEDEVVMALLESEICGTPKRQRCCIENYMLTIQQYSIDEFKSHFRITRITCEELLVLFGEALSQKDMENAVPVAVGRPTHPAKTQLLFVMWMWANQEVYRSVCDRFNIAKSTGWEYVHKFARIVNKKAKDHIYWPAGPNLTQGFKERAGFTGVVGAIDGTHFRISTPVENATSYINRNSYHSIQMQAVCDSQYLFIDCFVGYPGSVHDARVFRNSPLQRKLRDRNFIAPMNHLLGDSAYPNTSSLLTPFKDNGHLTNAQKLYNTIHSKTRCAIEQAFGLLKGRFRFLRHINMIRTDLIPSVILACCVLHNITLRLGDDDVELYHDPEDPQEEEDQYRRDPTGAQKRNDIMHFLFELYGRR